MDELLRQVISNLRWMWQRRWIGLAVAWAVGILGAAVLMRLPDKFEASARVYVDTESVLKPLMSGLAVQPDVDQQLTILSRTLISRPNVEKLIRMTDMDLQVTSAAEKDEMVDDLMGTLQIKGVASNNLYTISFRDANPEQAKRVVQSLLSIFVESSLGDKRQDSEQARKFIEDQIKTYESKLEEAENRLKEFKLKHMELTSADGGQDYFARMNTLSEELTKARVELRAAEQGRDAMKRELAGEDPVFLPDDQSAVVDQGAMPEIDGRLETLRRGLDELLRTYTEQHPDVVGTRRIIEQLEEQKKQELEARKKAGGSGTPMMGSAERNPVFQQLKISLADAEANVAALRARVGEYDAHYNALKASARMLPEVAAEFSQLNRDYDVQKRNYENLVSRRESAAMTGQMEVTSGVADFRVIDPPRVAPQPVAPNRLILMPLVLVMALAAGLFASFAASRLSPTFHDSRLLREITKRPVLGSVSLIENDRVVRQRKRRTYLFLGGLGSLIGCYGAAVLLLFMTSRVS